MTSTYAMLVLVIVLLSIIVTELIVIAVDCVLLRGDRHEWERGDWD